VSGLDTSSSFGAFEKMEEKVLAMEAEAESVQALVGTDSLEGKFKMLEGGNVDDELKQYVSLKLATSVNVFRLFCCCCCCCCGGGGAPTAHQGVVFRRFKCSWEVE
jgi:hypothetical protein